MSLQLRDRFGRIHRNLRVSVTDRCNLRCFYCMPAEDVTYLARPELLTFEEIERYVSLLAKRAGLQKLRLTGGEPLVRQSIVELISRLFQVENLNDISLTTNGILLPKYAEQLFEAGLRRVNISLDSLDPDRFQQITRRNVLSQVLDGIAASREVGFGPIKLNAVAIKNLSEEDLVPLAHMGREQGLEIRFIEYMPLDAERQWERDKVLRAEEIIRILSEEICPLVPESGVLNSSPAQRYQFQDGKGSIGIIASVSQPFCGQCDRYRLTSDGKLRNCLFSHDETDIRSLLRSNASDDELLAATLSSIEAKWEGHEINLAKFMQPNRPMHSIGG